MYKIIGGDGREYGPVSLEQLRQWMAENRVNAQTQVQPDGATEWTTLGALPEFAPGAAPTSPAAPVPTMPLEPGTVDIGSSISRAWHLVLGKWGLIVGATLLVGIIAGGVGLGLRIVVNLATGTSAFPRPGSAFIPQIPGIVVSVLWNFVMNALLTGGLYGMLIKLIRNEPTDLGDLFIGFRQNAGRILGVNFLIAVLGGLGIVCCIIPGIYLIVAWIFAIPLVVDKNMPVWEAMELSRKTITKQWWVVFGLLLLAGLIAISGVIACCIGIFLTAPMAMVAQLYAYEDTLGRTTPVHQPI